LILSRQETEIVEAAEGLWALQEPVAAYGSEPGQKIDPSHCF